MSISPGACRLAFHEFPILFFKIAKFEFSILRSQFCLDSTFVESRRSSLAQIVRREGEELVMSDRQEYWKLTMDRCFFCLEPAELVCETCRSVSFCGEEHYSLHKSSDGCLPYRLDSKDNIGRCMVATRDIQPGELIFRQGERLVCLVLNNNLAENKQWLWGLSMTASQFA